MQKVIITMIVLFFSISVVVRSQSGGKALQFDGIDDVVTIANGPGDAVNNFTIEMWVKPKAPQEMDRMEAAGVSGVRGQRYLTFPAMGGAWEPKTRTHSGVGLAVGTNCISVYEHAGSYMPPLLVYPCNLTDWTHIAVVYENRQPVLYLNGTFAMRGLQSPRLKVHLGLYQIGGHKYGHYAGDVDEVRYWSRALKPDEIQSNMNRSLSGSEEGLILYYNCNKMSSDGRLNDLTGNDHMGTLTGGARLIESTCPITEVASERATSDLVTNEPPGAWAMPSRPADLYIDSVKFVEPSGNHALDGYETGEIHILLTNRGVGKAQNIQVALSPLGAGSGLTFEKNWTIERISSKESHSLVVPVFAVGSVESMTRKIRIQVNEEFGFDADPAVLGFETVAYNPPDLQVPKVAINDREEGDAYGNGNSVIEPNESVIVTAFVQNFGAGKAESVKARITLNTDSPYLSCPDTSRTFDLGDIEAGDYREVSFYFFSTRRYTGEHIPLKLDITEARGDFGKTIDLGLKMNVRTENVVDVSIARVDVPKPTIKEIAGFQKSDIDDVPPASKSIRTDGLAVIIGIEDYKYAPSATFANRDAEAFYNYAIKVLGIPDANIYYLVDDAATAGEFSKMFDDDGWLARRVTKRSDVFIYYSGHGTPDLKTQVPYLIPHDIDPNYPQGGYSTFELYENLGKLEAKSMTVMLDACFSGQSRESEMLLANARPIRISVESSGVPPSVTLISASSGTQISSSFPEQKHGIFSYYLMKGMRGIADSDGDQSITLEELFNYVRSEVTRTAGRLDREQTPELFTNKNKQILVEY